MISNELQAEIPKTFKTHTKQYFKKKVDEMDYATLIEVLQQIFNLLPNENENESCLSLHTIKNIFQIILFKGNNVDLFTELALNSDFLTFLFQNITKDYVHPFFLKNALKIFCIIIENIPQSIDQLLENNLHNILITFLPNKYATKCIIKLIKFNEDYRKALIQSNFHKKIFQMISNLNQMNTDLRCFYEKYYIKILFSLHLYIKFDDSDYANFLSFFHRNFCPKGGIFTLSQQNYINFLIKSTDPELMHNFVSYPGIIDYLLRVYNKPAYTKVRDQVLTYFVRIIQTSNDYAVIFAQPKVSFYVLSMFNQEENLVSVSHFIYAICSSSYENCENFMTSDIFDKLSFHFRVCHMNVKNGIYLIFGLLLRYPINSSFFQFFSDQTLFDHVTFFEYIDMVLQTENEFKNNVITLLNTIFDYIQTGNTQEFLKNAYVHFISYDFYNILQTCADSTDKEFADLSKSLVMKIETLQ